MDNTYMPLFLVSNNELFAKDTPLYLDVSLEEKPLLEKLFKYRHFTIETEITEIDHDYVIVSFLSFMEHYVFGRTFYKTTLRDVKSRNLEERCVICNKTVKKVQENKILINVVCKHHNQEIMGFLQLEAGASNE